MPDDPKVTTLTVGTKVHLVCPFRVVALKREIAYDLGADLQKAAILAGYDPNSPEGE